MTDYIISEEHIASIERRLGIILSGPRSRPLSDELKKERDSTLNEFMTAIEFRFDDTNRGRGVVGTIRGIKESLRSKP